MQWWFIEAALSQIRRTILHSLFFEDVHEIIERNHYLLPCLVLLATNKSMANSDTM